MWTHRSTARFPGHLQSTKAGSVAVPPSARERTTLLAPVAILLLMGLLALPEPGGAGTGLLLSQWMTRPPQVDGQITAPEWDQAKLVDLGAGVTVRVGNNSDTLYLGVVDALNAQYTAGDGVFLSFDDEGGAAPVLDDNAWGNVGCHSGGDPGEGALLFSVDQAVTYQERSGALACSAVVIANNGIFASAEQAGGVSYELAIPLDGLAPLRAGPGQRFALGLEVYRDANPVACLPSCPLYNPSYFLNLVLSSVGCNTAPQNFGSGDPRTLLPLDWAPEYINGGPVPWIQSRPPNYGDPVFCDSNETGGGGAAACSANVFLAGRQTSYLYMHLPLGEVSATVRLRATLVVDPISGASDALTIDSRRADSSTHRELEWWGQDHSGLVELPLTLSGSSPMVELTITHWFLSAGGAEGGWAQIDDVELLCDSVLFADGLESGRATRWSATH